MALALRRFIKAFWPDQPPEPAENALQLSTAGVALESLDEGSALLHPGMVVLLSPTEHTLSPFQPNPLNLSLRAGPDSGRVIPLQRGRYQIGRGRVDVPVADSQLSRHEATLEVSATEIQLLRGNTSQSVTAQTPFQLGETTFELSLGQSVQSKSSLWPPSAVSVEDKPPEGRHKMMLAFALVPLLAGLVLVAITGMWFFLLFSSASALLAGGIFFDHYRKKRRYRRAVQAAAQLWSQHNDLVLGDPGRLSQALRNQPGRGTVGTAVHYATPHTAPYQAAPPASHHLTEPPLTPVPVARLGQGTTTAHLDRLHEPAHQGASDDEHISTGVAVVFSSAEATILHGPQRDAMRLMRWLLVQLVLNPAAAEVCLLTHPAADAGIESHQVRDMPRIHVLSDRSAAEALITEKPSGLLIVMPTPQKHSGYSSVVSHALSGGWHVILSEASHDQSAGLDLSVPGYTVDLSLKSLTRRHPSGQLEEIASSITFDGMATSVLNTLLQLAIPAASYACESSGLPQSAGLPPPRELFAESAIDSLMTPLGPGRISASALSSAQPFTESREESSVQLDLVTDGPHILIGGTTGSGKSELLKTLLTGLTARYSPEELTMVLIDFKGGATFQRLSTLPHSLNLVTDLSQAQAERTLEGIRSELTRREQLFLEAGASDYVTYRAKTPHDPLPRIVVVIDEFRIFSHELPDSMDELMRLATLGRSLGLHLVLSTQRPQGVVTADIRANIGASIALRVRSADESRDVIGTTGAEKISRNLPGRAILHRPGDPVTEFQTAQLRLPSPSLSVSAEAQLAAAHPADSSEEDDDDVVDLLTEAVTDLQLPQRHTPLLPPLPRVLAIQDRLRPSPGCGALLARVDDPAQQRQDDLNIDPALATSLVLLGEANSGATEALQSVVAQLTSTSATQPAHYLYLFDGDRSLAGFAHHPSVASWLTEDDLPEVDYLLTQLRHETTARRMSRDSTNAPLILIVSGYPQWAAAWQGSLGMGIDHHLGQLAADGPASGVTTIISGGRELALGKLAARIATRLYLPFGAPEDVTYLWPKLRHVDPVTGRGVLIGPEVAPPGLALQLVGAGEASTMTASSPHSDAEPARGYSGPPARDGSATSALPNTPESSALPSRGNSAQHRLITEAADSAARPSLRPPISVRPLPEQFNISELPGAEPQGSSRGIEGGAESGATGGPIVGVQQFTHAPATLDIGHVSLILGTQGTGKSTCLRLLEQQLPSAELLSGQRISGGVDALPDRFDTETLLLLDDAQHLGKQHHLLLQQAVAQGLRIIATCPPSVSIFSQLPWSQPARTGTSNVILSPTDRSHADAFAARIPVLPHPIPGRAVHLGPSGPALIQWALPKNPVRESLVAEESHADRH